MVKAHVWFTEHYCTGGQYIYPHRRECQKQIDDAGKRIMEDWLDDPDEWYAREVERMKERAPA